MSTYYIQVRPFGIGSRVTVSATNLTPKGAVKKFKALGYDVKEEDVKIAPVVRPCICFDFHIPTYDQKTIDQCKQWNGHPEPWQAKTWNTDVNTAHKDAMKAEKIIKAADIECNLSYTSLSVYKDTNTEEGIEFARIVVETLRKPKKELK